MTYEEFICVLVPSRGFHYINEEREVMVGTLKFSSPRGDFIILTIFLLSNTKTTCSFRPLAGISLY